MGVLLLGGFWVVVIIPVVIAVGSLQGRNEIQNTRLNTDLGIGQDSTVWDFALLG